MSGQNLMQAETFEILRHIEVHGPRSRHELIKGLQRETGDITKRAANLLMMGYLALDQTTNPSSFALTSKARKKLSEPFTPAPISTKPRSPRTVNVTPRNTVIEPRLRRTDVAPVQRRSYEPKHEVRAIAKPYSASEYAPSVRPGAMYAFTLPSRVGDTLRYRDGRITDLAGNPVTD
jgi:hypothetical protein